MNKMTIKATHPRTEEGSKEITVEGGSLEILNEEGQELYTIKLREDGRLEVYAGSMVKINGQVHETALTISPHSSNIVFVGRQKYESKT